MWIKGGGAEWDTAAACGVLCGWILLFWRGSSDVLPPQFKVIFYSRPNSFDLLQICERKKPLKVASYFWVVSIHFEKMNMFLPFSLFCFKCNFSCAAANLPRWICKNSHTLQNSLLPNSKNVPVACQWTLAKIGEVLSLLLSLNSPFTSGVRKHTVLEITPWWCHRGRWYLLSGNTP